MTGTAHGLGIGPGDPELITLRALDILRSAPVIAYPALADGDSLARAIVAPHLPEGRVEIAIRIPMGQPADRIYDTAAGEIALHLEAGRDVAVLCEGDPFFYGSFMYLFARLAEKGHAVRTVPGVSSLTACAAELGAPLAARNDILKVLPAPLDDATLGRELARAQAVAIIKLGRHLPRLRTLIDAAGLTDRARYIERATLPRQRSRPLGALPDDFKAPYFSMILMHARGAAWQ